MNNPINYPPQPGSDDEILNELLAIKRSRHIYTLLILLVFLGGFGLLLLFVTAGTLIPGIISVILAVIFCIIFTARLNRASRKLKETLGRIITRPTLEEVFLVEDYQPCGGIAEGMIRDAGITGSWDRYTYSDFVKGKYKGVDILFSDVHLEERRVTTDSEGNTQEHYETIFRGPWLVCNFSRELAARLRLIERTGFKFLKKLSKSDIETENMDFNDNFRILTQDAHNAFYVLTPHFMERILEIDRLANAKTSFSFQQHRVQIALYNRRDSFELKGVKLNDIENIRRKFRSELRYLTDILDEILSNEKLFKEA